MSNQTTTQGAVAAIFPNDPAGVSVLGGGRVCWDSMLEGPTTVRVRREHSDAAIIGAAERFGADPAAALAFRDTSRPGDHIELRVLQ